MKKIMILFIFVLMVLPMALAEHEDFEEIESYCADGGLSGCDEMWEEEHDALEALHGEEPVQNDFTDGADETLDYVIDTNTESVQMNGVSYLIYGDQLKLNELTCNGDPQYTTTSGSCNEGDDAISQELIQTTYDRSDYETYQRTSTFVAVETVDGVLYKDPETDIYYDRVCGDYSDVCEYSPFVGPVMLASEYESDPNPDTDTGSGGDTGSWNIERQDDNSVKATSPKGNDYIYESRTGRLASEPPEESGGLTELEFQDDYDLLARLDSFHVGTVEYELIESGGSGTPNDPYKQIYKAPDGEMFQFVTDEYCSDGCWVEVYKTDDGYDFCGNNLGNPPCTEVPAVRDNEIQWTEELYRDVFTSSILTAEHGNTINTLHQGQGPTEIEILSHKKGDTIEHYAKIDGEYVEVYDDGGVWEVCTSDQDGNECDSHNDGLTSNVLNEASFGERSEIVDDSGDAGDAEVVAEADRIYGLGWGGRDGRNWGGAVLESLQLAGSTQWISDLVFGPERNQEIRERYDRAFSNFFTTEYFASAICAHALPEVLPGEGLGQIIDSQGNPVTVAHITGQKHGPQPYMCDMESEEVCPEVNGEQSECVDMICEIDDEPVEGYLYVIEWSVRVPTPLILESCTGQFDDRCSELMLQVTLDRGEDSHKDLYEDQWGSSYPIILATGAQESDRIVTYSVNDYNHLGIYFNEPIVSGMGSGTTSFMERKTGTDGNKLSQVTNTIVEISSPTSFSYSVDDELPASTLSSETSTVEQVQI